MDATPLQLQQQQLILRLPVELSSQVRELLSLGYQSNKKKPDAVIDVQPRDSANPSDDFIFCVNKKDYPALLLNLPSPLESHKTFDNKVFLKSSDIGQMLHVFHNESERDLFRQKVIKTNVGDFYPSGMTPPTNDVIKRRFELSKKNDSYLPFKIKQMCEEISCGSDFIGGVQASEIEYSSPRNRLDVGLQYVMESVTEEVVDYEEWMADTQRPGRGISVVTGMEWNTKDYILLQLHPEMLLCRIEAEEDELEALALNQLVDNKPELKYVTDTKMSSSQSSVSAVPNQHDMLSFTTNVNHSVAIDSGGNSSMEIEESEGEDIFSVTQMVDDENCSDNNEVEDLGDDGRFFINNTENSALFVDEFKVSHADTEDDMSWMDNI